MAEAEPTASAALQVDFRDFLHARHVGAEHVFDRTEDPHAALPGGGEHGGDDVQVPVVGGAGLLEDRIAIELGMRPGVVPAVKELLVGLQHPVVRKRVPGNLPAGQSAAVGEGGQVNCVHRTKFLQKVKHLVRAFVHERHSADLDANGLGFGQRFRRLDNGRDRDRPRRSERRETHAGLEKLATRRRSALCDVIGDDSCQDLPRCCRLFTAVARLRPADATEASLAFLDSLYLLLLGVRASPVVHFSGRPPYPARQD